MTNSYFYGPVNYFAADCKTPHGGTLSLIKRTISPANSNITEDLMQPPRVDGMLNGSTIEGNATLDASGMTITKISKSQYGVMCIQEAEKAITQDQFEACKTKFQSSTSSKESCQL